MSFLDSYAAAWDDDDANPRETATLLGASVEDSSWAAGSRRKKSSNELREIARGGAQRRPAPVTDVGPEVKKEEPLSFKSAQTEVAEGKVFSLINAVLDSEKGNEKDTRPFYERPRFYVGLLSWIGFCMLLCFILLVIVIFVILLFTVIIPYSTKDSGGGGGTKPPGWCYKYAHCTDGTNDGFAIFVVVDRKTSDAIPGAVLETVNHIRYTANDRGIIYVNEPGMMAQEVYFSISATGYSYPNDTWGYRGAAFILDYGSVNCVEMDRDPSVKRIPLPQFVGSADKPPCVPRSDDYAAIEVLDGTYSLPLARVSISDVGGNLLFEEWTDSNGLIAFYDAEMMGGTKLFNVSCWSYGFSGHSEMSGFVSGQKKQFILARLPGQRARRLYRTTGQGIYGHSTLLGVPARIDPANLVNQVLGLDSVITSVYNGKLYWFWGDTLCLKYRLGNFATTGATTGLPGSVSWSKGLNFGYFSASDGFVKPMISPPLSGFPVWTDGVITLPKSPSNPEKVMVGFWSQQIDFLKDISNSGMMVWNDQTDQFDIISQSPPNTALFPANAIGGARSPFIANDPVTKTQYLYFGWPNPVIRVPPYKESWQDMDQYSFFTCLVPGGRLDNPVIDTNGTDGSVVWGWKTNTSAISPALQDRLVNLTKLGQSDLYWHITDVDSGAAVTPASGTITYNAHLDQYVLLLQQSQSLGDIWFGVAASFDVSTWTVRKVVTNPDYLLYNVYQHNVLLSSPEDAVSDEVIYFEGTFSAQFTSSVPVPRYDYNNVMYSLNVSEVSY